MHVLLFRAVPRAPSAGPLREGSDRAVFACVARGSAAEAEGVVLGELHRAGWKVLEVYDPSRLRQAFPGLKRHPEIARAMTSARQQGMAILVLAGDFPSPA